MKKELRRSKDNKIIFGIAGGLSEYFDIDAVIVRLGFVFVLVFTGFFPFGLVYILSVFVIPEADKKMNSDEEGAATEVKPEEVKVEEENK